MTKVNTFDHIFQEVELGHNLNSTLTEGNFWLKIIEFYSEVFHELLNSPFKRKRNLKRFMTFFCEASIDFFNKLFPTCHGSNWWRISWNLSSVLINFFVPVCLPVEITRTARSMTFKMSKMQQTRPSFWIATELVTS